MSFLRLDEVIKKAKERYPRFSNRFDEAEALVGWTKAVGPIIAKHSQAVCVKNRVLFVEVDHPIWKTELLHRKDQILTILNSGESSKLALFSDIHFLDMKKISRASAGSA